MSDFRTFFYLLSHPRIMAKKSRESVPFSCIAMAMPSIIQRWGWSDGMPIQTGKTERLSVGLVSPATDLYPCGYSVGCCF